MGVAVLELSGGRERYASGHARQAMRTGVNHARAAGLSIRPLDVAERARFRERFNAPGGRYNLLLGDEHLQRWWGAVSPEGEILCVNVTTSSGGWAVLERHMAFTPGPLRSPARYALHVGVVENLAAGGVRRLVGPWSPALLLPGVLQLHLRLGFEIARVRVVPSRGPRR